MTILLSSWAQGKVGIDAAWKSRQSGGSLLDSLEQGLVACEMDPELVAIGYGSLPNADGELELDAAIMDGESLKSGAVCAMRGIVPAISVARRVMQDTPHMMIAGDQARRFAMQRGFKPQNQMTAECIKRYDEWRKTPEAFEREYIHSLSHHGDTITMLGWEKDEGRRSKGEEGSAGTENRQSSIVNRQSESGLRPSSFDLSHCVAASSTSGRAWKLPGRVGDSPIVGAGIYADDEVGCAGATGLGEELWTACVSFRTVEKMRQGMSAQEACEDSIRQMLRRQPASADNICVVMAIRADGDYGAATTQKPFPMWVCVDGEKKQLEFAPLSAPELNRAEARR
jgi:N4-(beta-N-acetylglucosaminyl)-L-asparaginase